MTEELKQEAQQYTLSHTTPSLYRVVDQAYLAGAEPREKQIQIDAEQIRALQKQNGELTDRVRGLEAQNKKLQNCWNCKKSFNKACSFGKKCEASKKKCKEWEIKNE